MFYHNIVVLAYLLLTPANALSHSGDRPFQQLRQLGEPAENLPGSASSIRDMTPDFNDGIHLAVSPLCGLLSSATWAGDLNTGIDWEKIELVSHAAACVDTR